MGAWVVQPGHRHRGQRQVVSIKWAWGMLLFLLSLGPVNVPNMNLASWSTEKAIGAISRSDWMHQHPRALSRGNLSPQVQQAPWEWLCNSAPHLSSKFPLSGEEKVLREVRGASFKSEHPNKNVYLESSPFLLNSASSACWKPTNACCSLMSGRARVPRSEVSVRAGI